MAVIRNIPNNTTTITNRTNNRPTTRTYLDLTRPLPLGPLQGLPYSVTPPYPSPCLGGGPQTVDWPQNMKNKLRDRETDRGAPIRRQSTREKRSHTHHDHASRLLKHPGARDSAYHFTTAVVPDDDHPPSSNQLAQWYISSHLHTSYQQR